MAVGVFSAGGLDGPQVRVGLPGFMDVIREAHALLNRIFGMLSDNPHAFVALASVEGVLSLQRHELSEDRICYWQAAPPEAVQAERSRHNRWSLVDPDRLASGRLTSAEGRRFAAWCRENSAELEYLEAFVKQASDLVLLKASTSS